MGYAEFIVIKMIYSLWLQDKRLVGTIGATLTVKILSKIRIEDASIAVFDRELAKASNVQKQVLSLPNAFSYEDYIVAFSFLCVSNNVRLVFCKKIWFCRC